MARKFAQIHTDIWEDDDFLELGTDARFVYIAGFAQKNVTYCGVMVYSPARLVRATGMTAKRVAVAVADLHARRFIHHDDSTGEILVRSYVRNNNVMAQPQLRKAMERSFGEVISPAIRTLIVEELGPDYSGPCKAPCPKPAREPAGQPAPMPRITGSVVTYTGDVTPNPAEAESLPMTPAESAAQARRAKAHLRGVATRNRCFERDGGVVTVRDDPPELPACLNCGLLDEVGVIDVIPKHDPNARYVCGRCCLIFTGSALEAHAWAAKAAAREAERGVMQKVRDAGVAAGVIHGAEAES